VRRETGDALAEAEAAQAAKDKELADYFAERAALLEKVPDEITAEETARRDAANAALVAAYLASRGSPTSTAVPEEPVSLPTESTACEVRRVRKDDRIAEAAELARRYVLDHGPQRVYTVKSHVFCRLGYELPEGGTSRQRFVRLAGFKPRAHYETGRRGPEYGEWYIETESSVETESQDRDQLTLDTESEIETESSNLDLQLIETDSLSKLSPPGTRNQTSKPNTFPLHEGGYRAELLPGPAPVAIYSDTRGLHAKHAHMLSMSTACNSLLTLLSSLLHVHLWACQKVEQVGVSRESQSLT
jgi:hypothetical protein